MSFKWCSSHTVRLINPWRGFFFFWFVNKSCWSYLLAANHMATYSGSPSSMIIVLVIVWCWSTGSFSISYSYSRALLNLLKATAITTFMLWHLSEHLISSCKRKLLGVYLEEDHGVMEFILHQVIFVLFTMQYWLRLALKYETPKHGLRETLCPRYCGFFFPF